MSIILLEVRVSILKNITKRTYRPDIDGLRAFSVLSVLFFHLDFVLFSGGFIGVDVFFVISGYLITKNITEDVKRGHGL